MSAMQSFKEKLQEHTQGYSSWQDNVEEVVEGIKGIEDELGIEVTQTNGWHQFNSNEYQHYFLSCSNGVVDDVKEIFEEQLDTGRIEVRADDRRSRSIVNIHYK